MKFIIEPRKRGLLRRNQHQFRIVSENGKTLATSEGYNNKRDAHSAAVLIQVFANEAVIQS